MSAVATPVFDGQTGSLGHWQLVSRRFVRHRAAAASLYILAGLYCVALLADFVAPHPADWHDTAMIYAPPQTVSFRWHEGLHTRELRRIVDPVTLKNSYARTERVVPLRLFASGEPYKLWGLISCNRHLIGPERNPDGSVPGFFLLGADRYGRDIFSRLVHGARISLSIGLVAIAVTFLLGVSVGGISGYVGGTVDNFTQRFIEVVNSFPQLPLWLALAAVLPGDWPPLKIYFAITILLSVLGWTGLARVVRGKVLALREEDYATAAKLLGASHARVVFRHLLPGVASHIIVSLTLSVPAMILGETALSFLGLGLRPPVVSWGVMLQDCMNMDTVANYPWILSPVLAIFITVLAFNFVGDGLRDAADPYAEK